MDFFCANTMCLSVHRWNLGKYLWENTPQPRSWGSDVKVSAAAMLLQTAIVTYTSCTETTRGKDLLEKSLSALWTIDSCALTSTLKSVSRLLEQQEHKLPGLFFFINSIDWLLFHRSYFAVKLCWGILKLLCPRFCVRDIDGILFSMVLPLCSECLKFASYLTKSLFRSLYVMALSFQMPVAPYCVLM